jgi:hypothetical protein
MWEPVDEDEWRDRVERFADPGGGSALHVASEENPRVLPCPTCRWPNRLTPADRAAGYQCDACADALERGYDIDYWDGEERAERPEELERKEQGDG